MTQKEKQTIVENIINKARNEEYHILEHLKDKHISYVLNEVQIEDDFYSLVPHPHQETSLENYLSYIYDAMHRLKYCPKMSYEEIENFYGAMPVHTNIIKFIEKKNKDLIHFIYKHQTETDYV